MILDRTSIALELAKRIVIDDRSRLPGRFFGRFATSSNLRAYARSLMLR